MPGAIQLLSEYDIFLWHWGPEESNYALPVTLTLEKKGVTVFPNFNTCWHFDKKHWQQILLHHTQFPLINTNVFYRKKDALKWANSATYPLVHKLSGGASSTNVQIIKSKRKAKRLIHKAFGRGFSPVNRFSLFRNQVWKFSRDRSLRSFLGIVNGIRILLLGKEIERVIGREKGFIYFQDYIEGNDYDTRIITIGNRSFAVRRYNRKGDFRASGSGVKAYDRELFDLRMVKLSFEIAHHLKTQSIACDFLLDAAGDPVLVEISYGFITGSFYERCHGFWDQELNWHSESVRPEKFIIDDILNSSGSSK